MDAVSMKQSGLMSAKTGNAMSSINQSDDAGDMFMTLLLAQIKNQSPDKPMDSTEFMSQLIQMEQMESTRGMHAAIQQQGNFIRELQGLAFGAQVGQQVLLQSDTVSLKADDKLAGRINLSGEVADVKINLTNTSGTTYTLNLGKQPAGPSDFSIDLSSQKPPVPAGDYKVSLDAGADMVSLLELQATITAVRLPVEGGEPILSLTGLGYVPTSAVSTLLGHLQTT